MPEEHLPAVPLKREPAVLGIPSNQTSGCEVSPLLLRDDALLMDYDGESNMKTYWKTRWGRKLHYGLRQYVTCYGFSGSRRGLTGGSHKSLTSHFPFPTSHPAQIQLLISALQLACIRSPV